MPPTYKGGVGGVLRGPEIRCHCAGEVTMACMPAMSTSHARVHVSVRVRVRVRVPIPEVGYGLSLSYPAKPASAAGS